MATSDELFDIFDERMKPIGTASRAEVHAKGYWHQTFHCWLWREWEGEVQVLFQLRHPEKDIFPDLLDISCAGHLLTGESVEDGVRELEEELGVAASFHDLIPCGVFASEKVIAADCIDREFSHVFLHRHDQPLEQYTLQADEVTGLYALGLDQLELLAARKLSQVDIRGVRPSGEGKLIPDMRRADLVDFVLYPEAYYRLITDGIAGQWSGK
ncbi:NUDIX hydrolase [Paenibacillus puerhi]|uniref:NUDIX hydrolase n=1 Tax=Paenibacillus puerhi TaxID=2692622 RepID=UPI001358B055|nr:NUDIX domain-containing protein [Paenibacillus puerhi]